VLSLKLSVHFNQTRLYFNDFVSQSTDNFNAVSKCTECSQLLTYVLIFQIFSNLISHIFSSLADVALGTGKTHGNEAMRQ